MEECALRVGEGNAMYCLSVLLECTLVLMDEYLQKVCFCGVERPLNAILYLIQN